MDSVTYLRQFESCDDIGNGDFSRIFAIADEYAALLEENERMRKALEALRRARRTAMEQTIKARIPECAEFAGIAQDLDFVVAALEQENPNG